MIRKTTLLLTLTMASMILAACGVFGDDSEPYPLPTQSPGTGPGGMSAIVRGVLEVDLERGCVWLATDTERYPVLWPTDTEAQRGPFRVTFADGSEARPGDSVRGGGGYIPVASMPGFEACADDGEVAVFNPGTSISVDRR